MNSEAFTPENEVSVQELETLFELTQTEEHDAFSIYE